MGLHGQSMEFLYILPTWHENSMEYFTRNLVEYLWKISRVFPHEIPWGIKSGPLFCMIALARLEIKKFYLLIFG